MIVDLDAGTARVGGSATADTLRGISTVHASGANDTLIGAGGGNLLIADGTGNTLIGGGDGDRLTAGGVDNTLIAGSGAETLTSYGGANTLVGGDGDDTFVYDTGSVVIQVLRQPSWGPHADTLQFTGLNQSDLAFTVSATR